MFDSGYHYVISFVNLAHMVFVCKFSGLSMKIVSF